MSVNSVAMFYGKLATNICLQKEFAEATAEFTIRFAAQRGYLFTDYDLQLAGETMQGFAKQFGKDVKQLHQHHVGSVGKAAAQGIAQGSKTGALPDKRGGLAPGVAQGMMSAIEMERILDRLGNVLGGQRGSKKKSG